MYKSEDARRQEINKLKGDHDSGGGFVPKQFKSSRSNPHSQQIANKSQKERNDLAHENAIFSNELVATVKINVNDSKKLDQNQQQQPPNKVNSSIMHESVNINLFNMIYASILSFRFLLCLIFFEIFKL